MTIKKDTEDLLKLIFATVVVMGIILITSYINYEDIQGHIISKEQQQLLTISKSVSSSIERFFEYHSENLEIITKNKLFKEQFKKYMVSKKLKTKFDSLENYYIIQKDDIDRIQLLSTDFQVIDSYPKNDVSTYPYNSEDMARVLKVKSPIVSRIYSHNGQLYIRIYEPVYYNSKIEAIVCIKISLDKIYEKLVKAIRTGENGYASVKDQNGVLLMHPKKEDLGVNIMEARRQEFPDYDWSELDELVQEQMAGGSGVGVYHSFWYHDKERRRIKKFSAYSPARIDNQFWIVTVSMDYVEMTQFIRNRTYKILILNLIIILIFISCMFYIYKIKKGKRQLEKETKLLKQVNDLNKELEKDIEERKSLEKELIRSKKKYERLFNSGSDCTFVLNLDDNNLPTEFLEVNKKACISLEYNKATLLKKSYLDISVDGNKEKFKNIVKSLKSDKFIIFEDTLISSNGREIPVEVSAHLFNLERQLKLILIARDITNKKIQEEALKRSEKRFRKIINQVAAEISDEIDENNIDIYNVEKNPSNYHSEIENKNRIALELEEINIKLEKMFKKEVDENRKKEALMIYQSRLAAMGEMIGNIAHQWRQPLSCLGLIFANIEDAYYYEELTKEYLEDLVEKSQKLIRRMSQTIDDFRYFFNPKSEEKLFSVKENIELTVDFLYEKLKLNEISLNIHLIEDGMIYGHPNQYSQVIFNILQNSIDALIENRSSKRKIDIRIFKDGDNQIVEIEDNGKGVDKTIINHIFQQYFTTKSKGKGTGLGLYMSKVIIEKNFYGSIDIYNQNNGLCVSIIIPQNGVDKNE